MYRDIFFDLDATHGEQSRGVMDGVPTNTDDFNYDEGVWVRRIDSKSSKLYVAISFDKDTRIGQMFDMVVLPSGC